jgi:hypothetical protein
MALTIPEDIKITEEECAALRTELKHIAAANFMRKHLQESPKYSIRELLYAFGYALVPSTPPSMLTLASGP